MNKNKSFSCKKKWYNLYVFISYSAFLLLKFSKYYQKWIYIGMGEVFFLETWKNCPKVQQNTVLFRHLTYLKPDTYSGPFEGFMIESFSKNS